MAMKVFQNLNIECSSDQAVSFIESLTVSLDKGWRRNQKLEEEVNRETLVVGDARKRYCFSKIMGGTDLKPANLWLREIASGFEVENIVPTAVNKFSCEEYNKILSEFYDRFVLPVSKKLNLITKLSNPFESLENWSDNESVKKLLESFSNLANKGTSRGHPLDDERWQKFVIEAHKKNDSLNADHLRRWLIEEEGWDGESAWGLAGDYEYGRDLLKRYDNEK